MSFAIRVENLGKRYQLGLTHAGSVRELVNRTVGRLLGRKHALLPHEVGEASELVGRELEEDGGFWALRDVSFEVKPGEVVGIIGRNGSGKSTLLKVLSQITAPTRGRVEIRGRVASLLEVGTGFHPELTGRENVFLNGAILGMTKAEVRRKFDEIVAFAEVEKFIDTPVKRYSSGMYVRLAFAVAAHLEPEILVVDEVLAVGDVGFQKKCLGKMNDVAKTGRTILFVSHNMAAVRGLCDTACWLDRGLVQLRGEKSVVIDACLQQECMPISGGMDLREIVRTPPWGERLRLTKVTLNEGKPVVHGAEFIVEFEFEGRKPVEGVSFGIGISSLDGTRVLSLDSDLIQPRWEFNAGQGGTVRAKVEVLHLEPGTYCIDAGARTGDSVGLDYIPAFARLDVLPGSETPSFLALANHPSGGWRLPAKWCLSPGTAAQLTNLVSE